MDEAFDTDLLLSGAGLIIADGYGGEVIRMAPEIKLAAARRKALLVKFAHHAANRLQKFPDPEVASIYPL